MEKADKLKIWIDQINDKCDDCINSIEKAIIKIINEHNIDVCERDKSYREIELDD